MIIEVVQGKFRELYKYTRENWKEWFVIDVPVGAYITRGYLPVRRDLRRRDLEFWIFPLAPFVWLFYVVKNIGISITRDCIEWLEMLEESVEGKKK